MSVTRLQVTSLGAQGDGIAMLDGHPVFVPMALPGETVEADLVDGRARDVRIIEAAPDRQPPACSRYGVCGGCSLQHLPPSSYLDFKRAAVVDALRTQGLAPDVDSVIPSAPHSRRRAVFAATRTDDGVLIGFNERKSARVTDIPDCAVLEPDLLTAIEPLKALVAGIVPLRGHLDILVTLLAGGLDVAITNAPRDVSADLRAGLASGPAARAFARVSINGEIVVQHRPAILRAGDAWLAPPPGGFLQAVESAQTRMVDLVSETVRPARRIADLFAGSGTFALPLAARAPVHAVESNGPALDALAKAAQTPGLKPVTVEKRDLFRRPLTAPELARFDAVVIDPPRAGAEAQCTQLASSKIRTVAMVSCSASTFARDVAILCKGGFKIRKVTPVDQFLWSPHVEIVAHLSR